MDTIHKAVQFHNKNTVHDEGMVIGLWEEMVEAKVKAIDLVI